MIHTQVAILGCGFAGPVLALSLKQRGIKSVICEVRNEQYTQGGNIALAPNALRVLDHLGIFEKLRVKGYNYSAISFDNAQGHSLGKLLNGSKSHYNYDAVRIARTIVRNALREKMKEEGVTVRWEMKVTEISETVDSKVLLKFKNGEQVTADFLVGADGIHSQARTYFAGHVQPQFSGLMGLMGHVDRSELSPELLRSMDLPSMLFGPNGSFAIMPASFDGNDIGYFATLEQKEDRSREEWMALEEDKTELARLLHSRFVDKESAQWNPLVAQLVEKTPKEEITNWPWYSVPHLDSWFSSSGRVIIIGDAAHAIPPTGGQGAAMALEDAETLSYAIAHAYAVDEKLSTLLTTLHSWQDHRMTRIAQVVGFTSENGDLRRSSATWYSQMAKEWLIWGNFRMKGETGGAEWLYSYNTESVRAILP